MLDIFVPSLSPLNKSKLREKIAESNWGFVLFNLQQYSVDSFSGSLPFAGSFYFETRKNTENVDHL